MARDGEASAALERRLQTIELTARTLANAMEFDFLLNRDRRLLSIGYRVAEDALDSNCYDLLASEWSTENATTSTTKPSSDSTMPTSSGDA